MHFAPIRVQKLYGRPFFQMWEVFVPPFPSCTTCASLIGDILYELFIASIQLLYISIAKKGVRLAFIPKLGQLAYTLAKAFRPISSTSFKLKTLERLIDIYLRDEILSTFKIRPINTSTNQGNRQKEELFTIWSHASKKPLDVLGGFIDLVGAFNDMTFNSITASYRNHQIDETTTCWIRIANFYLGTIKVTVFARKDSLKEVSYHPSYTIWQRTVF